ncbi:hypothetical protein [Cupriavidus consociatus]|uniref:hypothetical protein n=1 Tax=Cupriavidus consociatus TaxID=2821357 RepID=UPI001AEB740C|nr:MULTISPECIES: hypothetical protein [unclassified Cupriavidus]MBP0620700.1 hypothetical protein [Cupriavidus sp. LEh25]MDK2657360.1 hypothetical protein [Cupriavidus sp. LEh21]
MAKVLQDECTRIWPSLDNPNGFVHRGDSSLYVFGGFRDIRRGRKSGRKPPPAAWRRGVSTACAVRFLIRRAP